MNYAKIIGLIIPSMVEWISKLGYDKIYLSNFKYTSLGYDQIWICFMVTSWCEHETYLKPRPWNINLGNDYHRRQVDHSDQLHQQNGGIAWQNFCFNQQWNMYKTQNILILQCSSCSCFSHTHMRTMVLEYLPTCARTKSPSHVGKYTSTMEHMDIIILVA